MSSDSTLLASVQQGEVSALATLYSRYASSLLRFAQRCDQQDAEDLLQATFLRVIQVSARFDGRSSSARSWLFGIMLRVAQERRRSSRRFGIALQKIAVAPNDVDSTQPDVRHDLDRALTRLSRAKSTVLWLVAVEDFSCEEVAVTLRIPIGTVWTRLHHARRELRSLYREVES